MGNKILFIGTGVMSEGLIKEILREKKAKPEDIIVNNRTPARMDYISKVYGVNSCKDVKKGIEAADAVIIGVKPQDVSDVLDVITQSNNKEALIISIAAGKTISDLEEKLGCERKLVRVMPNSMVDVKIGYSALCCNAKVTLAEQSFVEELMKSIGEIVWIKETMFDAFTGFSCTGPGFVYEFIEALVDAGVYNGISRADALNFTLQNLLGACEMIKKTSEHPTILKENMTSPGGTTITGLKVLNEAGFKGIVQNAVSKAVKRSREL